MRFAALALLLMSPLLPVIRAPGDDAVREMYRRYQNQWVRTFTFEQKTTLSNGSVEVWHEAGELPGKLRIDIAPASAGRAILFRADSLYNYRDGRRGRGGPMQNVLLLLLYDVHYLPPDSSIARLRRMGFDLNRTYERDWNGKPTLVVGATAGDTLSSQIWIERERMLPVRVIERVGGGVTDTRIAGYARVGQGWSERRVETWQNGKLIQLEEYQNYRDGMQHEPGLFEPTPEYVTPRWISGSDAAGVSRTTIVMLGTGTPIPEPERSGPSVAIVVDSVAYLFDAGVGVVRRAAAAAMQEPNLPALSAPNLGRVFLTHLHSDHTMGLNDLILTPWVMGRTIPLELYGPPGSEALVKGILDGNAEDIRERLATAGGPSPGGWKVNVHPVSPGIVYSDARIRVRAFSVPHSALTYAFGYRIDTPDRSIVISGDVRATDVVARECNGCDVLIHEVYSDSGLRSIPADRRPYHMQAHTSASQLGRIAQRARPKLLILYHQLVWGVGEAQLLREMQSAYPGVFVAARDLQRFTTVP